MSDDVLMFFSGHMDALPIYEELEKKLLAAHPDTKTVVQKTQITFKNRRVFGCASFLPAKRKSERPEVYLTVTFGLDHPRRSDRIAVATEAAPNRWTHHVLVAGPEDIDDELMGWLAEAYAFSEGKR